MTVHMFGEDIPVSWADVIGGAIALVLLLAGGTV
jgi:hypothetical protein